MARNKSLSLTFLLSLFLIAVLGLIFFIGIYFYMQKPKVKPFSGGPVTSVPKSLNLELASPNDELLVFKTPTIISGRTAPLSHILIASETKDSVVSADHSGDFSTVFDLKPGV